MFDSFSKNTKKRQYLSVGITTLTTAFDKVWRMAKVKNIKYCGVTNYTQHSNNTTNYLLIDQMINSLEKLFLFSTYIMKLGTLVAK